LRTIKSTLIVLLLGLTTAVVVGLLLITLFLPTLLQRFACAPYGIRCTIGQANIRPHPDLTADLVIDHLILFDPDGRGMALRVKRLAATLSISGLILTRQVMPTDVRIESPELFFRQLDDGRWNLQALAQEVQRHLLPAARPTPLQFPRASVTNGILQIRDYRVTDINVALEPKPSPVLFEMQAQAAVSGRSVRVSGALQNTLEGRILAQIQEAPRPGILRPLTVQAALRFRVNHPDRTVTIPDWSFETVGALARGTADVRYVTWPPAYTLTVAEWRVNLDALAHQFPLPWLAGLTGIMEGKPTTLQGNWPDPPVGQVAAMLKNGRLKFPAQQFGVAGLTGNLSLQHEGNRLHLQAGLHGKALELRGQRYGDPSLLTSFSIDPATGRVTAETLRVAIAGMRIEARGTGRRWGRDSLDLMTTELHIEPALLAQLSHLAGRGVSITRVVDPSIHVWWPGAGRPWKAEIMSRSIQLHAAVMNGAVTLQNAQIAIQGTGVSGRHLEGGLAIEQANLAGRRLRTLKARFEFGPDQIRLSEFHVAAGDGDVRGHASFSKAAPLHEAHMALSVRGLHPQSLLAPTEKPAGLLEIPLDAELSAALSRGLVTATVDLPPAVTKQLRRVILGTPHTPSASQVDGHLLLQAQGTLQTRQGVQASGSIRVQGLRELLAGGEPTNRALPVELAITFRDGRFTLKTQELGVSAAELTPLLSRLAGRKIEGREGRLVLSGDATFGGSQPPTASGTMIFRGLSLSLARQTAEPVPLLTGIRGAVTFTLDRGLLTVKETALRTDGELTLILRGSLPLDHKSPSAARVHLSVPWTEMAALRSPLTTLTGGRPDATRLTGQFKATLELIGQEYHGALSLQDVSMGSNFFRLDGASGVIPLHGHIGQSSIASADRASPLGRTGARRPSEQEYQAAVKRLSKVPTTTPVSLTISSLRSNPVEIRDIKVALASSENRIDVRRLAFDAWGGRWSGWGTIEPLGGGVALTLLTEELSLRAICDAFQPVKGYISGRVNGLLDLRVPQFAVNQAQGGARFWAVDSPKEKRKISRALIEQLAGQQIRYFSLFGVARRYDRGILDVALRAGDLIFHELEISHTILGFKDLDVRVSPAFNKIGLAHLLETIGEAIERIRASAKPNQ
jgi:hypothetical protein